MNAVDAVAKIDQTTIALGLQLGVSAVFVLLMVVIHGLGLLGISRLLKLNNDRLEKRRMNFGAVMLVGATGVLLFLLHFVEIFVFALFFLKIDIHIHTLTDALYFSSSSYATLGSSDQYIAPEWQLIGSFEAVIGFVLIGWSTAFVARVMSRLED